MAFMVKKNIVKYIFTQNIDGLELKAGIPKEKIVFAHGTFDEGHCPTCKCEYDINEIKKGIEQGEVRTCSICNGPCKPHVVFYGEQLSESFFQKANEITSADLGIVMGTSLKVHPFSALPKLIHENDSWRIAINRSRIGNYKYDYLFSNSLYISGTTDDIVKQIIHDCNWDKEFNDFICKTD